MFVSLFVVFNGFLVISLAAPPPEHNGRTFRNALNQQSLQTILQSIEERLRNLDQIYSIRYTPPSINTDQYIRKIELLESKLSRMESQITGQLDQISEKMNSKAFKDDIAKDQLFRKMDSVYERINHKLGYVEGKFDMDILKLQTKLEAGISKIERLDHSFSVRQADMEVEVSEAVDMMANFKNNVGSIGDNIMNISKKVETTFDKQTNLLHAKFDNMTDLIAQIDKKINNSLHCNQKDILNDFTNKDTDLTKTFKGYEDQIQTYGNKVNSMYSELWKKSNSIENTIKNSVLLMNLTREEIQDIKNSGHKFTSYQNDGQLEIIVDTFTNTIQRKFAELGRKLENNFENVMLVQNLFLESCHRIQMDETQLEHKISLVLEKLLDAVTNKSINTFKEIQSMEELIKSHDTNVYRTMNQNTNTIIKLSEKTSEDRKKLEKILSTVKKDIGNALETIKNEISSEDQENNQKYDTIASILLELQEQVNDLDNRVNEDNTNYNAKQMLHDILLLTKDLADKDTFAEDFNSTIRHNVEDISKLMTRIYHLLTSIDTKINKSYLDYKLHHHQVNEEAENIINNTKNHANITNFSGEENGKVYLSDEVTEPVDIVLEILPEKYQETSNIHSLLSRFNYTIISDKEDSQDYDEEINQYIPVTEETTTQHIPELINYKNSEINSNYNTDDSKVSITIPVDSKTKYGIKAIMDKSITTTEVPEENMKTILNFAIHDDSATSEVLTENYKNSEINRNYNVDDSKVSITIPIDSKIKYGIKASMDKSISTTEVPEENIKTILNFAIHDNSTKSEVLTENYNNSEINRNYNADDSKVSITIPIDSKTIYGIKASMDKSITTTEVPEENIKTILNFAIHGDSTTSEVLTEKNTNTTKENTGFNPLNWIETYLLSSKNEKTPETTSTLLDEDVYYVTNTPVSNNNGTASRYIRENKKDENNNLSEQLENTDNENNFPVKTGVAVTNMPVSETTIKSVKTESVTKETFDDDTFDEIMENTTLHNSFEYSDSKNNQTNDEHIRDDYEWDYEE